MNKRVIILEVQAKATTPTDQLQETLRKVIADWADEDINEYAGGSGIEDVDQIRVKLYTGDIIKSDGTRTEIGQELVFEKTIK